MAIYYVSATTGHDSADGSAPIPDGAGAGPKATIGAAENLATSAGDIVYIAPGTYREQVLHGYSGTSGNRIYFIGAPDCDIFPNGEFSSPTYGVTPGVVRITRADSDEFCSDTSNDYCVKSNVHTSFKSPIPIKLYTLREFMLKFFGNFLHFLTDSFFANTVLFAQFLVCHS